MKGYELSFNVNSKGFSYGYIDYHFFQLREVLKDGKPTGEYHLKVLDGSNNRSAVDYLNDKLSGCEVGLIDPEEYLKLEYPIYIKINNPIIMDEFNDYMSDIDEELNRRVLCKS